VAGPEGVTRVYFENYTSPFAYLDQVKLEISNWWIGNLRSMRLRGCMFVRLLDAGVECNYHPFRKEPSNSLIIWQFVSTPDFMFSPVHYVMGLYEKQEKQENQ
jgi:hypothetical protein